MAKLRQIAFYGKGGIGKSTTSQNTLAALAEMGQKILIVGCDPKADSTRLILHAKAQDTILSLAAEAGSVEDLELEDVMKIGYRDIRCVESGGPEPGVGCAGRGIITAIELLKQKKIIEEFSPDIIIYDVLGDVVCGGFAMPIREGVAEQVYTVSSSDFMSLYASNNLFKGIKKYSKSGGALFSGIIGNSINLPIQEEIIQDFAANTKVTIAGFVPRSLTVAKAELQGKTTIEADPDSDQAELYRNLARGIINNQNRYVPGPLGTDELKAWAESWYDRLLEHNKNQDRQSAEPVKNDLKYYDLKPDSASVKVR